jgi:transcriptional regulator with XRE-family HTH domain
MKFCKKFEWTEDYDVVRKSRVTTLTQMVLSQRELARMAGLTQMTVWRIENGYRDARPGTIRKLAGALGVEPKELVKEDH